MSMERKEKCGYCGEEFVCELDISIKLGVYECDECKKKREARGDG